MFSSNTTQVSSSGYQISRSLRFNSADSAYLNRTPASNGNRRTFTFSCWIKKARNAVDFEGIFSSANGLDQVRWQNDDTLLITLNATSTALLITTQVFRDISAWGHLVIAFDTTQATASNRIKLYWNGVQITAFGTSTYPTQNYDCNFNSTSSQEIGKASNSLYYLSGYLTEVNFIDGQALTPSSFGQTDAQTGVWTPIAYSGSYGTNGFYLNFSDNSNTTAATLGKDYSGNGNNWTPNNFSVTAGAGNDSLVDSPTSYGTDTGVGGTVRGNYATLNPLNLGTFALTNGNLDVTATGPTGISYSTIGMSSGKWYWEVTCVSGSYMVGIGKEGGLYDYRVANGYGYFYFNGQKYNNNTGTSYGATYTTGDIIGVGLDMDAGTLTFYKNGTSQGTAYSGLTGTWFANTQDGSGGGTAYNYNFGQRPFAYTAPSGYKALCTQNLPTPTIGATTATQAGKYFNPVLYTGTGASSQSITGVGFAPDFTWIKSRNNATSHALYDQIRGAQKTLVSNSTNSEQTYAGTLDAFGSDGFTVGNDLWTGANTYTYVAWNWKANGSGSTNTSGSITSTVSANTTSGFSVVTYTNASSGTVGHGLGVAPAMVIYKDRTNVTNWVVLHQSLTNMSNYYLKLNLTDAVSSGISLGGNPTSSVIYTNTNIIQNGAASVAYCFAEVAGYSKFGSYTGNADTNGPFVFTGFRPAYVLIKATSISSNNWFVYDSTRSTSNLSQQPLLANASDSELNSSSYGIDLLSNGFKIRATDSNINQNNATYIYMALASNPFKYSLAR